MPRIQTRKSHNLYDTLPSDWQSPSQEVQEIIADPLGWLARQKLTVNGKYTGNWYIVTFTYNPNSRYDKLEWLRRVNKEVHRYYVLDSSRFALEHMDTNIHCHAVMETSKRISKVLFKIFNRDYGYVDLRRINVDNDPINYIEKEMPKAESAKTKTEFLSYYLPIVTQCLVLPQNPSGADLQDHA